MKRLLNNENDKRKLFDAMQQHRVLMKRLLNNENDVEKLFHATWHVQKWLPLHHC